MLALATAVAAACNRPPRRPIERRDGGPAVVLVDRRNEPRATGPTSPEVEPNDVVKSAQAVEPGVRVAGSLAVGATDDVDVYALRPPVLPGGDLGAPRDLGAADGGVGPTALGFITVQPTDAAAQLVIDLLDRKGRAILSRAAPAGQHATLHYLRLDLDGGATVRVRLPRRKGAPPPATATEYTLEYAARWLAGDEEPQPEIEPDDQLERAVSLPPRGTLTGRLDGTDDRDLVALPALAEGATYRIELAAIAELALEVQVRAGKEVLASARGGKGGELRLRNAPGRAAAPLVVQLRVIDGASDTPYTLRVASESALDGVEREPNDKRALANPGAPGQALAGYLWPGDADWFCAPAGTPLGARVEGLAEVDWKLELAGDDGVILAKADAGKKGAGESLDPVPGANCVRLSGRARDTAFDAPYHVTFLP